MNHSLYFCLTRAQHTSLPGITTATARYNRDLNTTIMHWPGISTAPGEIAEGCCIDANSTSHRNIHVPTQEYPCGIDCHLNFAQKYPCARIRRLMLRFRSLELQLEAHAETVVEPGAGCSKMQLGIYILLCCLNSKINDRQLCMDIPVRAHGYFCAGKWIFLCEA